MIGFNTWYIFENKNDKRYFLEYARKLGALKDKINVYPTEFLNAECLRIKINNGYVINYRTTYCPEAYDLQNAKPFGKAERDFILQEVFGNNTVEINSIIGEAFAVNHTINNKNLGEIKMNNNIMLEELIVKARNKEFENCNNKRAEALDKEYAKCEIGKQAQLLAFLIEANTTLKVNYTDYFTISMLPLNAQRGISQINEKYDNELKAIEDKYRELMTLLSLCDTYEQKEKLLKDYKIITKR